MKISQECAERVVEALVNHYGSSHSESVLKSLQDNAVSLLVATDVGKPPRPPNPDPLDALWYQMCKIKGVAPLMGRKGVQQDKAIFIKKTKTLVALHSIPELADWLGEYLLDKLLPGGDVVIPLHTVRIINEQMGFSPYNGEWVLSDIKLAKPARDVDEFVIPCGQAQDIIKAMGGETLQKEPLISPVNLKLPRDLYEINDGEGLRNRYNDYVYAAPIATKIFDEYLAQTFPKLHAAIPFLAQQFEAIDTQMIKDGVSPSTPDYLRSRTSIAFTLEKAIKELQPQSQPLLLGDVFNTLKEEYSKTVRACMAMKWLEYREPAVVSLNADDVAKQSLVIDQATMNIAVADFHKMMNSSYNSNDRFLDVSENDTMMFLKILGVDGSDVHIAKSRDNENSYGISGAENIARLKHLAAGPLAADKGAVDDGKPNAAANARVDRPTLKVDGGGEATKVVSLEAARARLRPSDQRPDRNGPGGGGRGGIG